MPVLVAAGEATQFNAENDPHMIQTDLSQQAMEAIPSFRSGTAMPLIFIDDFDSIRGPAQFDRQVDKGILSSG